MEQKFTFNPGGIKKIVSGLAIIFLQGLILIAPAIVNGQTGVAPVQIPAGGFAVDGNLLARTPVAAPFSDADGDFLPNEGLPGTGGYVFTLAGVPLDTTKAFHVTDGYDAADASIFTGGSKFNGNPNNWVWKTGKPTAKDDMNQVLFFFTNDAAGNLWFVGSGDRKKTNGNTYFDFELLQNPLYKNSNNSFTSLGPDGGRTSGDLAITVIYTIGGTNPQLVIHKWTNTGGSTFDWVQVTPPQGTTYLTTNKDSIVTVPFGAFGANTYQINAFTEVACNLSDLIPGAINCMDIKTVIAKTKASQSINAELKDFINPVQVMIKSAPEISVNSDTICYGDTASLTATIISGAGPFSYLWSTGDTTQTITVSPDTTTTYTVVVTGGSGCSSEPAVGIVTVLPLPEITITGEDTICFSESSTLSANIISGTGPFTYLWNTGDTTQSITVAPDITTLYSVIVTASTGCESEPASITVVVLPLPEISILGTDSICTGESTELTANVLSGTGPFTYLWSTGDTTQVITIAPDTTTLYSVIVTASTGCESEPASITVVVLPLPEISISGTDSICFGGSALLMANVISGTGPFTYLWNTGDTTQSITVAPDSTTLYTVVVTASTGCESEPASITVEVLPLPEISISGPDSICFGGSAVLMANVISGTGPFTYLWNTGDTLQSITVAPDSTTLYTVVVTASSGCESEPASITVLVLPLPEITITGPDSICLGENTTLIANVISGAGPFTYLWNTGDTLQSITVAPDSTTLYTVVVTAGTGCESEPASINVVVMPPPVITITGPDSICLGENATFTANVISGIGPFTYLWNTGEITQSITVSPDTATLYSVVVTTSNGCVSEPVSVTIEVLPLPESYIIGPDTLCPAGTGLFTAPDLLEGYAWTVAGNGSILGNSNEQTVTVQGNGGCDSTFTLTLTVTNAGGCSSTSSMTVFLTDSVAPVITNVPGPAIYQCTQQVPVAGTQTVTVTDDCPGVILVVTDSVTSQTCYDQFILLRKWLATDKCGNTATASQIITVMDTIAPLLEGVPADTGFCCLDSIPVSPIVTAYDDCDGLMLVTMTEAISDSLGPNMFILTRTWTAYDSCNNMITDSQVITINDTLYPPDKNLFGIESAENKYLKLGVGPNPFNEFTNIQFVISEDAEATLDVYNSTGVRVKTLYKGQVARDATVTVPLLADENMKPGVYLLVLKTSHSTMVKQIVLTR